MYLILLENGDSKSATKGVSRVVGRQDLTHDLFGKCLMESFEMTHLMVKIGHTHN